MVESIWVKEPGGIPIKMDLPLGEGMAGRLATGSLVQCTADGEIITEDKPIRPSVSTAKPEWVGYLVKAHGYTVDDAEAMTKQDIIDRVTQLES